MAKIEVQISEDLDLTAKELNVLRKRFKKELVEAINARRAKQMHVDVRAKSIAEEIKLRPRES